MESREKRKTAEDGVRMLFTACAAISVLAVAAISFYMAASGIPAICRIGLTEIIFGTVWNPTGEEPAFGILYIILTSLAGTLIAALIGVPVGVLTAVYLSELSGKRQAMVIKSAVEVLAGIPSVIYGLLGIYLLNPLMYRLERKLFAHSDTHQFTGGANLLCAALVLAVMILPTVINISEMSIRGVDGGIREASLALGATRTQTIFRSVLPAAAPGIATAVVLGLGRAVGEAMAITLVSGGSVNPPFPFRSVRFLTTAIVSEMGYAHGLHRQMLFTIGLVLFAFIMLVNLAANGMIERGTGGRAHGENRFGPEQPA